MPALGLLVLLSEAPGFAQGAATTQVQHSSTNLQGSVLAGRALFTGTARFKNQGPACGSCHSVAGLAFPNGGSLGPDLTGVAAKLGPIGLAAALRTLFFPTMTPIFDTRPLVPQEQRDLAAFFNDVQSLAPPRSQTAALLGIAVAGCAGLLGLTWAASRRRPVSVRQALLKRNRRVREVNS